MILYRDKSFVIVNKPAGVAAHRGWAHDDEEPLLQQVRDLCGCWVYLVHRLDRGASGCVLLTFSSEGAAWFQQQWHTHVEKRYFAITRGHPAEHVVLDHAIPKAPGEARVDAVTEFWRRETFGRYALVEASPITGRLHQIRRHLKHLSCPIIGDVRYGKGEHNRIFREHHRLHRLALHAHQLVVPHPNGHDRITVNAPLPDDMAYAIASAKAHATAAAATAAAATASAATAATTTVADTSTAADATVSPPTNAATSTVTAPATATPPGLPPAT